MPSVFSHLTNFFFPPLCVHCGVEGDWLCSVARDIVHDWPVLVNPIAIPKVDWVVVRASYDCAPLAHVVQKLKYSYWTGLDSVLPELLQPIIDTFPSHPDTVIIPVPLHARRLRERGFNQSVILGRALSRLTGFKLSTILSRTRYTTPQAGLPAAQRITNIIGAFDRQEKTDSYPKSVILVDDVITTGSTIAECASVLRQLGVNKITAIALAKG